MDPGLNFDEKLENVSLTACKKCYYILVRKPTKGLSFSYRTKSFFFFLFLFISSHPQNPKLETEP